MAPLDPEVEMTAGTAIGAAARSARTAPMGRLPRRARSALRHGTDAPQSAAGTSIRKVVPAGPVRSTRMPPPFAVSSSRAIVRPSPSPVGRPVVGSVARATSAR